MSEHETPDERDGGLEGLCLPPKERERFERALALLSSGEGVLALVQTGAMQLEGLGVYEALLARSWAIRYENPPEMCHLARVAVEMCERFDSEVFGAHGIADLQARAWGELANAYRVADRFREAGQAFGQAFTLLRQGSGDRRLLRRLLDFEASFFGVRRDFSLALQRLAILAAEYREAGEPHLAGRALITKALYTFYSGNVEQACKTIEEGLSLINADRDPSVALVASLNQLLFLVELGRFREARKILFKNRSRIAGPGRIVALKLRAIEGRIDYGLGTLASAETAFREVKMGFLEIEKPLACALAGLELAMTLMRQGREEEAFEEGLEAAARFLSLSIHREIIGTVIFLEDALRNRKADLALLEVTVRYLRKTMMELGLAYR